MRYVFAIVFAIFVMGASSAKAEDGFDQSAVDFGDYSADYDYPYVLDDYENCEVVCEI